MVLIRYGRETTTKQFGRQPYYEDSVWSTVREALLRQYQLEAAGYYPRITESRVKSALQYTVWSSRSKRRGSRRKQK
jgi:hypothetical protein